MRNPINEFLNKKFTTPEAIFMIIFIIGIMSLTSLIFGGSIFLYFSG